MHSLLVLFFVPFIASGIIFLLPTVSGNLLRRLSIALSLIPLALLIFGGLNWMGSSVDFPWLPPLAIRFHLSIDSLSLLFLYLVAVIVPISVFAIPKQNIENPNVFYALVLLLEGLQIGFFTARDLALFTVFWEAMLFPLYFIISIWGGPKRQNAALKFLIYMIAGSTLMIAAILLLYFASVSGGLGTFDIEELSRVASSTPYAPWLCGIFLLAFAVKVPLFPFHAWLPDAYYEAPLAGTILLSALLSKAGIYGIVRIGWGFFPQLLQEWSPWLLIFAVIGVFYGGFAAWMQNDYKRLISYSSLSHVNFVLAGLFVWNQMAHTGAILQALNHGITITGLFLVAGWLQKRLETTAIGEYSGLAKFMPYLCWLTLFFVLSSVALPGMNNFIGELLIFLGLFQQNPWTTAVLVLTIILSVIYMLRWMQTTYFDAPGFFQEKWIDLRVKEFVAALPLVVLILWIGIYPAPLLKLIEPATENIGGSSKPENVE